MGWLRLRIKFRENTNLQTQAASKKYHRNMSAVGHNLVLAVFVFIAGAVLFFYGHPWLDAMGHGWLSYVFFAILIVVLLYARAEVRTKRRSPPSSDH